METVLNMQATRTLDNFIATRTKIIKRILGPQKIRKFDGKWKTYTQRGFDRDCYFNWDYKKWNFLKSAVANLDLRWGRGYDGFTILKGHRDILEEKESLFYLKYTDQAFGKFTIEDSIQSYVYWIEDVVRQQNHLAKYNFLIPTDTSNQHVQQTA